MSAASQTIHDAKLAPTCAGQKCEGQLWSSLQDVCDLLNFETCDTVRQEETLFQHRHFKAGERIFRLGEQFDKLYVVRVGFLKSVIIDTCGDEQILGFPMKGDLTGIDGLHSKVHVSEAVALSDGEVIILPYKTLRGLALQHASIENMIYNHMSRELVREQAMIGMLSGLAAEARVAKFLLTMGERFEQIGYSRRSFNLRMTRREIGAYLGVTLETVSRTLSIFAELDYISVDGRTICIKDEAILRRMRRIPASMTKRGRQRAAENDIARASIHLAAA
jgi:CRP/FNR family transcriptional regulator